MKYPPARRCAIYTRKSSEEGLEQDFNSLDAQYESCAAYVASQKSEGWTTINQHYDDGGFSGGNMDRPGLKRLMADIEAGLVDIVVVYKIDRLTRSLMDFSKLVEVFDRHGVTFVSVTQSFNTTTSMGRLTLNVLLSFAQFEREVTGERIRDKIAASKKKGMWMGGAVPAGYILQNRQLIPDSESAPLVRHLFNRYLALGSVSRLHVELKRENIRTRAWRSRRGTDHGQALFSRGLLYSILKNVIYIGRIRHADNIYDGQHEGIIDMDLWQKVQSKLAENATIPRGKTKSASEDLLKGKLFDPDGIPYSPTFSTKGGRRYRYYISQNLIQQLGSRDSVMARLPAPELEDTVIASMKKLFSPEALGAIFDIPVDEQSNWIHNYTDRIDPEALAAKVISRITIRHGTLEIGIDPVALQAEIMAAVKINLSPQSDTPHVLNVPFITGKLKTNSLVQSADSTGLETEIDPFDIPETELNKWIQGIIWRDEHFRGTPIMTIAAREGKSHAQVLKQIARALEI